MGSCCFNSQPNQRPDNIIIKKIRFFNNETRENKIQLIYKINKPGEIIRLFGSNFCEKNKDNCEICIDLAKRNLLDFYKTKDYEKELKLILKIDSNITDLCYMFYGCSSLKSIPDLYNLKIDNVTNISYMFAECTSLEYLPNISIWNTEKITDMSYLFFGCSSLEKLPDISQWNTKNVENMSNLFYGCSLIKNLYGIGNWNTKKVKNISYIFCKCSSVESLTDISKWDTSEITDMSHMFHGCSALTSIDDISIWKTNNVTDMSYMFCDCSSLKIFPYIEKWKTNNVTNMSYMFYNCSSLESLHNISTWNTDKVTNINMIFYNCPLLSPFPDISKWKCYKNNNDNNNKYNIEVKGDIKNDNLKFIPKIEFKFNNVNNYDVNVMEDLRKEIKKLIKTDNFSIIKFQRGSLSVIITLQYLVLRELQKNRNALNLSDSFFTNIDSEVESLSNKLKEHNFITLGNVKPDLVKKDIINITEQNNRDEIKQKIGRLSVNNDEMNLMQEAKNIESEDLEKYFKKLSQEADEQEINIKRLINRAEEFNKKFDEEIEVALKNSYFEYKIIHILLIDKDYNCYINNKKFCPNREVKILFHGTTIDSVMGILSNQFRHAKVHFIGKGVYFTNILDYAWLYAGDRINRENFNSIPKVGNTFTCVASEIYYDKTKKEIVYNYNKENEIVENNGIRCAYADWEGGIMNRTFYDNYNGFTGNEYLITNENQYVPIYGVTLKRVEYLVIWRDYNFDENNPNQYEQIIFDEIKEFHRKIKKIIARELNTNIYYINSTEEALELIDRKKYNKIIVISNGNNNGREFINNARQIMGGNAIAAISAYNISRYVNEVRNMKNVLLLHGIDFHEKFFKCIKNNDINLYQELKNELNNYYHDNMDEFSINESIDDLFNFPNFKNNGSFGDLTFGLNRNNNNVNYYIND